jgi:uncharacterized delta-60 repeat protein
MRKTIASAGLVIVVLCVSLLALDVSEEHTWGGLGDDPANDVAVAPDGSVYVTGTTNSFPVGDMNAFLLKYSPNGSLDWQRMYGAAVVAPFFSANDFGLGVAAAPNGSAYVTGQFGQGGIFLVNFDSAGNLMWQQVWQDTTSSPTAVEVGTDGSIYVAGVTFGLGAGGGDALLLKFAPDGTFIWARTWGGFGPDAARDMAIAPDGAIYLAGGTASFVWDDAFLVKFAEDGTLLSQRVWGTMNGANFNTSNAWGVGTGADGSVYITGTSETRNGTVMVVKFDPQGNVVWERIANPGFLIAFDVAQGPGGNVYVTGHANAGAGSIDAYVLKMLPNGKAREAMTWGGSQSEEGRSLAVAADGTILMAGYASAPPYVTGRVAPRMSTPDGFLVTPDGIVTEPSAPVGTATGIALVPTGTTTYGGGTDAALLRVQP